MATEISNFQQNFTIEVSDDDVRRIIEGIGKVRS